MTAVFALGLTLYLIELNSASAQIQRVLGLDISSWQGNISQTTWNNIRTNENRRFIISRSSRGGTTGFYNQNDANNVNGLNTLSQRYDDQYYVQNMNRVVAAGMLAGSYHFSRPDITATTVNSGGIPNSGADEADHFIQMAGPWMRPGYLVPVHDFEAGDGDRTDNELTQFCIDFSNRIYEKMGIRPAIYVNGNYTANILQTASAALRDQVAKPPANVPSMVSPCYPTLWDARWPNQTNVPSIDYQGTEPKDTYSGFYGPWDDYGGPEHPWHFWQYASTGRLQSYNNGANNLDFDVARGGMEFLKDQLVPAIWTHDGNGDWSTLTNWNSGLTPVAPVRGPGQIAAVGAQTLPTPRLPGSTVATNSGLNDTVILERPNTNIIVTISSGTHIIRKLYMRETLNLVGGSLAVNYVPSEDSTTNGAQFSGSVTLSNSASFSAHTLQVDTNRTFTLAGGTLSLNMINLMPHASAPARILVNGDVIINPLSNVVARISRGLGSGSSGFIDLAGGTGGFNVGNGTNEIDLSIGVPISNGALAKAGPGTMQVVSNNIYSGGTTVSAGRLLVNNTSGSGTGYGAVTVNGGILGGSGTIAGVVTVNGGGTISPGASIGTLVLSNAPVFIGTNFMEINRNSLLSDKISVINGTLNYGGTLFVTNVGPGLLGGEIFTLFYAPSYAGAFVTLNLPQLDAALNWFTGALITNGTIKVNRQPQANPLTLTNDAPLVLQIPFAALVAKGIDADGDSLALSGFSAASTNGVVLTTNGTSIVYSNFVSIADRFNYILSDGRGGSATGIVQIASSPAGRFAGQPTANGTTVTLHFVGSPGLTYFVERSTNLPVWLTIATNVAPASGLFDYADDFQELNAPPATAFYRLRWNP